MTAPPLNRHFLGLHNPRRAGRVAATIGVAVFVLQLLVWSFYAPVMGALGLSASLCLANGVQTAQSTPGGPDDRGHHQEPCGFCLLAQGIGDAPSLPVVADAGDDFAIVSLPFPGDMALVSWFLATHRARGPPMMGLIHGNTII